MLADDHPEGADVLNDLAALLSLQQKYDEAEPLVRRSLEITRRTFGERHPAFAGSLQLFANLRHARGETEAAVELYQRVLDILRTSLGEEHRAVLDNLNNLASMHCAVGNPAAAEPLYRQAVRLMGAQHGEQSPECARGEHALAGVLQQLGNYQAAEPLFLQVLEKQRKLLGEDHPDFVQTLHSLAQLYHRMGNYNAAEVRYRQVAELRERLLGEEHPDFAQALNDLAALYHETGNLPAAEPLYQRALEIRQAELEGDHPDIAQSLHNLALLNQALGRPADAEPLFRQALEILRTAYGERNPDSLRVQHSLALFYQSKGDFLQAEQELEQVLATQQQVFGPDHPALAATLRDLARAHADQGNHLAAEPLLRQVQRINRQALPEDHLAHAADLYHLSVLRRTLGDLPQAEALARESLAILRKQRGDDHPDVAGALTYLGQLAQAQEQPGRAEELYGQALEVYRGAFGKYHPAVADTLAGLAMLHFGRGEYATAEALHQEALEATRKGVGEHGAQYAQHVDSLAWMHQALGNLAAAEPLLRQNLELVRRAVGEDNPILAAHLQRLADVCRALDDTAAAEPLYRQAIELLRKDDDEHRALSGLLNNLALLYLARGQTAQAEPLLRQALQIDRKALGDDHPDHATTLQSLAGLCAMTGRVAEALALLEQVLAVEGRLVPQVFALESERQRAAYVQVLQEDFEKVLTLLLVQLKPSAETARKAFELTLRRKALWVEALAPQRTALWQRQHPQLQGELQRLLLLRRQIALKTLNGPGPEGLERHRWLLAEWHLEREELLEKLDRAGGELGLQERLRAVDMRAVAAALPPDAALVEYVTFRAFDFATAFERDRYGWQAPRTFAFVLAADQPDEVRVFDLGPAEVIDQLVQEFRAGLQRAGGRDVSPAGRALRAAVFDRVAEVLGSRRRLLLAPDGELVHVPFEALPAEDGRPLLDQYTLHYVGSGRDVLRWGEVREAAGPALVLADLDYDDGKASAVSPAPPRPGGWLSRLFGGGRAAERPEPVAAEPVGATDQVPLFERLPGTRAEGQAVAARTAGQLVTGQQGRKQTVLEGRAPWLLHLATPTFALCDPPRPTPGQLGPRPPEPRWQNPLRRAGVALAGANDRGADLENGLLTARDLAGADLGRTQVVTLSLADTGAGRGRTARAVVGLQRALALAGAQTLVLSLWRTPDQPRREFFEDFYQRLLAGQPRADALRDAQLALRRATPTRCAGGGSSAMVSRGRCGRGKIQSAASFPQ